MKNLPITLAIVTLTLAGCSTTYTDILNQKLAGKTEKEKRVILSKECKNKINEYKIPNNQESEEHSNNMKDVCQKMTGEKINLRDNK